MLEELSHESRADRYERWGHLLMATPDVPADADRVTLPDLFAGEDAGAPSVTIPLDPGRSAVENAQRYYDRARRTRRAREEAEGRLLEAEARAREAERLLDLLRRVERLPDLEAFRRAEAAALAPFAGTDEEGEDRVPFRRFALPGGYEVWVGRNARQNDLLTFRYARKHDRWLHARGVAGSHAVLRVPNRQAVPPRPVLEGAAAIAAYFSKARGSSLVPVIVAERKHVRKPRGAAPGAVVVEREEVLLVEPGLPE
jgi:predicted ribosome quality control (RQC) complex YloA/Tae2 family protein